MRRALVLAAVVLAGCGSTSSAPPTSPTPTPTLRGAGSLDQRFGDVPQHGAALGSPRAPYTLVEFADLQCPFCAAFDRDVLPDVIDRYVRPGRLRIELRPIAFLGPQSAPAAAATVAAGLQNRMWQFADLFYRNQGRENSGYVTPRFLGRLARGAGLDLGRFNRASSTPRLVAILRANAQAARTARITGTPGLRLGRTGGALAPFSQGPIRRAQFLRRLAAELS